MKNNKFFSYLSAFSLIELMISLITISCIMAAFTPILTKKLNKTNVTMSISEISSKCDKFSSDCVLCYPNKCLICNKSCTDGEIKDSEKCSCETCATMYPNCLECKTSGCQKCLSGYGLTADKSCELCPLGYYSDGSTSCKPCPIGKYQDVTGQSTCKDCPVGKYQDLTGQSTCKSCSAGKYQDLEGQSTCKSCPIGKYQDVTGQSTCKDCPAGKYQDLEGQTTCKDCPAGKYQDLEGQTTCKNCPDGKWSTSASNTCDIICEVGYSCSSGSMQVCSAGTYSSGSLGLCLACEKGKYQDITGQSSCKSCPAGKYQDVTGQSTCKDCPAGKYQDLEGQSSCKSCSSGYTPNSTKTGCEKTCSCPENYYSRYFLDEDGKKWERGCSSSCPENYGTEITDEKGCKTCQVVCPSNYRFDSSNGCVKCNSPNIPSKLNITKCTCPSGYYIEHDVTIAKIYASDGTLYKNLRLTGGFNKCIENLNPSLAGCRSIDTVPSTNGFTWANYGCKPSCNWYKGEYIDTTDGTCKQCSGYSTGFDCKSNYLISLSRRYLTDGNFVYQISISYDSVSDDGKTFTKDGVTYYMKALTESEF